MKMALYSFRLDSFNIENTRAFHNDTDVVSVGLVVAGTNYPTLTKAMGDVNNGLHQVSLEYTDTFITIDSSVQVAFVFLIQNLGYHGSASAESDKALNWVSGKCKQIISNAFGFGDLWTQVDRVIQGINDILFADCDGPVAADSIVWNGQSLFDATSAAASRTISTTKFYPGKDSAVGCGSNSKYDVSWSVAQKAVGEVFKISSRSSGKLLDVPGSSGDDGVIIQQYHDNGGGANQQWLLSPTDSGCYKIISRSSGEVLDVPGSVPDDGILIQQYHDNGGGANQQWRIVPTDGDYVKIQSRATGKMLDVPGSSADDNIQIQQYHDNGGGANQQWMLIAVK